MTGPPCLSAENGLKGWFVQSAPADSGFSWKPHFPGMQQYLILNTICQIVHPLNILKSVLLVYETYDTLLCPQ